MYGRINDRIPLPKSDYHIRKDAIHQLITPVVYELLIAKYQNRYASDIAKHKRR